MSGVQEGGLGSSEVDSESSSVGDERDTQKRVREDNDSSSPKKRRKQTTPVRVPTSLSTSNERTEFEEDLEDDREMNSANRLENATESKSQRLEEPSTAAGDDNLISEFDREGNNSPGSSGPSNLFSSNVRVKLETPSQEESENPMNLTSLGIKNFPSSWLSGHSQQQEPTDWTGQNAVTSVANHLSGLSFPGALAQYLPLPGFSLDPGQIPRMPVGPAPIRIFNPDAYCDLCNKEFCNKYFLKTHKANKHGIYVDTPQQNSGDNNGMHYSNLQYSMGMGKIEPTLPPPSLPPPLKMEIPLMQMSCEICQKRFKNEESLRKHKHRCHVEGSQSDLLDSQGSRDYNSGIGDDKDASRSSPSAMESLFKQEYGIEQEDTKFMPAPRHLSPQSSQQARESGFSIDRLRRLGVLNVEAFCEICCKEYCNKYFLRTHKMKRHGILIQDNDKSPSNPGAAATWHQIQTSPLNLIVTESNPGGSESNDKSEEYECKSCGIKFQTHGLYRIHRAKVHENSDDEKSTKLDGDEERTDSISEDLQKLQTMILQLNGLDSSKTLTCEICGRECENKLALKTHMTLEHAGHLADEQALSPDQLMDNSSNNITGSTSFCSICEKEFPSTDALKQHIAEDHNRQSPPSLKTSLPSNNAQNHPVHSVTQSSLLPPTSSAPPVPPIPPPPDKKLSSLTPTSSYCEICNKELCNKYFMKTHMQRMHGIEIENGSQIGGVICNICNKELCSKYFLRVHKHNTHGIVDDGAPVNSNKQENFETLPNIDDAALKPDQLSDLSHRYFTHFNEVCPVCNRRFRSIKWLKAHLLGDHGKTGVDKWRELEQQYQNTGRTRPGQIGSSSKLIQQNPNIKIPNGLDISQNIKATDYGGLGNQVLSTLFGGNEEHQNKNYRCSYCNFTTPVLPFLFLHERSHMPNQEGITTDSNLQCPICSQTFPQPESLHHHLVVQHQFSNLLSQYQQLMGSDPRIDTQERHDVDQKEVELKDERSVDSQINSPIQPTESSKNQKDESGVVHVTVQGAYKCAECGFATTNLHRIKSHVKKNHKARGDPTECVIAELSKTLRDVANKHKVPASYAMPQDMNSNPDATIMQPFILEERNFAFGDESSSNDGRFAPALVYLPVRTRINSVLTASFTLSPASIIS
ncbi:uncharacterized protein [Fopius arisanus]|uniref:C2H2-type domain-containing protein n=1 Tax=Fopius arisanus TaxID=64838 RepID=A0A9R1U0H9_9HYME|nr:PREDICTED: uncharacterized protein LOC105266362 [Fopius arisanus]